MSQNSLIVTSPSFGEGGWIPRRHSGRGEDLSPQLNLNGVSPDGKSIAVTMDDASHPLFPNFNHWVIWNIPIVDTIPGALPRERVLSELGGAVQGKAYGKHRYRGPKPPFKWIHDYVFTVFVMDCVCELPTGSSKKDLMDRYKDSIIQSGSLSGKFQSGRREDIV